MAVNCRDQQFIKAYNNDISIAKFLLSRAFILTLLIHLSVILLIINLPHQPTHIKTLQPFPKKKITAIKSYLYRKPVKQQPSVNKTATAPSAKHKTKKVSAPIKQIPKHSDKLVVHLKTNNKKLMPKTVEKSALTLVQPSQSASAIKHDTNSKRSFSALRELNKLQQQLDQQSITSESNYYNRPRGKSVFNDLPEAVKHSQQPLSLSEKREQMTTHYGGSNDIIKNDDGSCTLRQDLSNVGMEGITALSGFKCGQTKMEKAYDAHMDKVLKKLGKKKY